MKELIPQKGRKALGIIFFVTAIYLHLAGYQISFNPTEFGFIVFLLIIAGVVFLALGFVKRRREW